MAVDDHRHNVDVLIPKVHSGSPLEMRTGQLDDLLNEKLESAFHEQTLQVMLHEVAKIADEHDPIDLAYAATRLPSQARLVLFDNLPDEEAKIIFLTHASSGTRTLLFRHMTDKRIVELMTAVPPNELVWMVDDLSDRRYKRIFEKLAPRTREKLKELQKHDRDSAARLMSDEYFAFHMNTTIADVAAKVRSMPGVNISGMIYVLNDYDELVGFVPERNLIINPPDLPIRQVMQPVYHMVSIDTSRDEVVDIMERYELSSLPVIDEYHQLIGVISFEAAVEAMKDMMDDTIASIAGTAEDFDEHESTLRRFFWRAPWLVVTLFAGLINATSLGLFAGREWFIFVPLFVPLIAGLSGNVGIQCSTLLVRSMSTGELTYKTRSHAIMREVSVGLMIGLVFGLLSGGVVYLINSMGFQLLDPTLLKVSPPLAISMTVCFGIFGACVASTTLGSTAPFAFEKMGFDPAVAAGPIVTAFNDVMSAWIFILTAWGISWTIMH